MATVTVADEDFSGVGAKPGLEIWCIEDSCLLPIPKHSHGNFFSGSAYIVLHTATLKSGFIRHDVHYWIGKDSRESDAAFASDKVLELDATLGSCSVQYLEEQGRETDRFLSYFKPCIIPVEGIFSLEELRPDKKAYTSRLWRCKGEHVVHVAEVPFSRSSLSHNDVFILDTEAKMFLFCGSKSSMQERAKALEVVQHINENQHGGRCRVSHIEAGNFIDDPEAGEFWSLFGGYAPLTHTSSLKNQIQTVIPSKKLHWINKGKITPVDETCLERGILNKNRCYMLDCGADIFVWMGKNTLITERKMSISAAEDFLHSQGRATCTHIVILTQGFETARFKSHFNVWPQTTVQSLYDEGREKVAAIFKHQGYAVKEITEENHHPLIDQCGALKVWFVDFGGISLIPTTEQFKLFSGNCYVMQYIYRCNDADDYLFYAWLGSNSTREDRMDAISCMSAMADSTKSRFVVAQIFEGKEPAQFFSIFQRLIIYKGGTSLRYKTSISEKLCADKTYDKEMANLFRIQGSGPDNVQAIQVDLASSSLNSSQCYILQHDESMYTWVGSLSSARDHDLLDRMLDLIEPKQQVISLREGSESAAFWSALGEQKEYPKEKEIKGPTEDPRLFTYVFKEGDIKGREIFNFSQDDLNTEDILILDCYNEIFVWVGRHAGIKSQQEALDIGKKFLEMDVPLERLSPMTAICVITEGNEPPFFTCFFDWDSSKPYMLGNSFDRKLAMMKGLVSHTKVVPRYPLKSSGRYLEHCLKRKVTKEECFYGESTSPSDEASDVTPVNDLDFQIREFDRMPPAEERNCAQNFGKILPYEVLKASSIITVSDIDISKREAYLSKEEFQMKFGMTREAFNKLPFWRQIKLKQTLSLF